MGRLHILTGVLKEKKYELHFFKHFIDSTNHGRTMLQGALFVLRGSLSLLPVLTKIQGTNKYAV